MQENVDSAKKQENVDNAQRITSVDNSAVNRPKRTRTAPSSNRSFVEVAKGKRILGIVDRSNTDGKESVAVGRACALQRGSGCFKGYARPTSRVY